MSFFNKKELKSIEDNMDVAGILSAIWILASNDENPLMLYDSTRFRLGLPENFDLEGLIKKHGELFRQQCPEFRLEEWKKDMLKGKRIPIWVKEIENNEEREKIITNLSPNDVFRSQFRANVDAEKSDINIIDWGLEHIERIRKATIERNDSKWKWLKEGVLPILSITVALVAVITSSWVQYFNIDRQEQLKKYEISFKSRADNYSSLMDFYEAATESAVLRDGSDLQKNLLQLESAFYKIKPFLSKEARANFMTNFQELSIFLNETVSKDKENDRTLIWANMEKTLKFKTYFSETLFEDLFEKSPYVTNEGVYWRVR
jgi:hypothetical protein